MPTKIRYTSDLHMEFWKSPNVIDKALPPLETDKDSVLILAGDIGTRDSLYFIEVMEGLSKRFKDIFYIPGNHEYYGSDYRTLWDTLKDSWFDHLDNVHMTGLFKGDGFTIVGGTLWTDFNKGDPITLQHAKYYMNDYRRIKDGNERLSPKTVYQEHLETVKILDDTLTPLSKKDDYKVICVTHHAPSSRSVHPRYANDPITNRFYYSDLEESLILKHEPDYWFHGHTHSTFDYEIGKTRVICNPFGYYLYEGGFGYDNKAYIEV